MYYPTMAALVHKKKKGRYYTYWVRSARVDGKPRIVEQIYLGPKERVLEEIKAAYTRGTPPGGGSLRRLQNREFGASALLWHWAQKLGLAEIVDRHVPAPAAKRRARFSVGQYLTIAALNRAIDPSSKRALYDDWYRDSVLARLWKAKRSDLASQRFWDHMNQVEPEHIERIQHDLLVRLRELFPLGEETVLYDATNYFSFIDTFNERTLLAQRGENKQKRRDLRQLSLALFEDQATGLPLYHQCYPGNRSDAAQFGPACTGLLQHWVGALERTSEQLTLVFDRGSASQANFADLEAKPVHYVAGIPNGWVPEVLAVPLSAYEKLELPNTKHVKAYRTRQKVLGKERTLVVVFSPSLYRKQCRTMAREQEKAEARLLELGASIQRWSETRRGKGHQEEFVRRKLVEWTRREHLRDFLEPEMTIEDGHAVELRWRWNLVRKRELQRRHFGKQVLMTDSDHWDDVAVVSAYRRLARTERLFALSKSQPGVWWPMYHWTDSKIRVHALYCFFAMLLLAILERQLRSAGLPVRIDRGLRRLSHVFESVIVYASGATDRVLSDLDQEQHTLAEALGLFDIADALGTTRLNAA
jgi:transposase